MLRQIIEWCLHFRLVVILLALGLVVGGVVSLQHAPLDVFPEFAPPQIVLQTEAPGFSTEQVELLVTAPIEAELSGATHLVSLRSSSTPGLSVVTVVFAEDTNIFTARQMVTERMGELAPRLPLGVEPPRMEPLTASTSRLVSIGLSTSGKETSLADLRTLAEWTIRRRLESIPGVGKVEIYGGDVKQFQIVLRPEEMLQYDVSLDQVLLAARQATAQGGAGYLESPNQRVPIRQNTRVESPEDLAAVSVSTRGGANVPLGQVALVREGAADKLGDATVNGRPAVLLHVHKQPDANTLGVTQAIDEALAELAAGLPADVTMRSDLFRQSRFIERALGNLQVAILVGCALTTVVLIGFLGRVRTVAISLTAIPLSLLGGVLVLRACGASLNAMTLGGLAIAVGEVVDDAIVDVENVVRRLRENALRPQPLPAFQVVLQASLEVRSAVVYATFVVILVFLPVLFLQGLGGTFFRPLGYAYIAAIVTSLVVAITLTPALCLTLLPLGSWQTRTGEPMLVAWLKRGYRRALPVVLDHSRLAMFGAAGSLAAAVVLAFFLDGRFLPDFRETDFVVQMNAKPDAALVETRRMGAQLSARVKEIPGVMVVSQQLGRADLSEDTWGSSMSELWITVADDANYHDTLEKIQTETALVQGYTFETRQYLKERIDEVLTGAKGNIVVRVVGPELGELRRLAEEIATVLKGIEGTVDVTVEPQVASPELEIMLEPRQLARYGLTTGQVQSAVELLVRGAKVGQIYDKNAVHDVVVRGLPGPPQDPRAVRELMLDGPDREHVRLGAVAQVELERAPNMINREGGSRRILVTCNVAKRGIGSVAGEAQRRIAERLPTLPTGYHLEFAGEQQAREEAQSRLWLLSGASLLGIFTLLYLDFRSLRLTLLVLLSVPLVAVGGVPAVYLAGGEVSLGSMVGLVTVFGIAVRNGILLISHYQHLRTDEQMPFGRELILRGALERLPPILMTASTAALSLLPLVVFGDRPGYEIEHPMAVVILGGLTSSTLLSLFVIPLLYERFGAEVKES